MRLLLRVVQQLWVDVYNTAGLFIAPWKLLDVARNSSPVSAMYVGGTSLFLILITTTILALTADEPGGLGATTASEYLDHVIGVMSRAAFTSLLMTLVYLCILLFDHWLNETDKDLVFSIRMLAPATIVVPVLMWVTAHVLLKVGEFPGNRTGWMSWFLWDVLGAIWWLPVFIAAPIVLAARALRRLHLAEMLVDDRCPQCGYSLRGIERRRCPECGYRFRADES